MGEINLTELPVIQSVQRKPVKFRGNTNSSDYNLFQETAYFDVTNIYNVINEFKNELQEMSLAHSIDSAYTQMKIGNLPELLEQLQSEIDGLKADKHRKLIITPSKTTNSTTDPSDINLQYGQINIPTYTSTSKLCLYDETLDLVTIPSTLISSVKPVANGVDIIDTDFNNCIRGYENEYFIRKVITDSTEPVEMSIEVLLPDNIISNRDINALSISPFPYAALDVLNIEYMYGGEWKQLPGFTSHKLYSEDVAAIKDADNIKFCFSKLQMTKVKITLRQNSYIKENGKNVFYLGLKNLSITYDTVNQQMCTFMADINFGTEKTKVLHALTPKLNNANILSDQTIERKALFNFELYSVNKDGEKRHITDKFPLSFTDERLFVVTNMYYDSNNDINPSLYKLEIEYDVQGDGSGGNNNDDDDSGDSSTDNCVCILLGLVFNGDSIIIGADETSKPYKFGAACMLQGDCTEQGHVEKNIKYVYTIKDYGAGCRIVDDTMIVNSTGTVVITCTASIGKAVISKDAIFTVEKIRKFTLTYLSTTGGSVRGKKIQNIEKGLDGEAVEAIPEYGYYFVEWSDGVTDPVRKETDVQSSAIITAKFELITYQVTFLAEDGSVIVVVPTKHGFAAEAPEPPEKIDYLFTGWSGPIDCITEDTTVTAQYTIKTYVVEFYNWDNTLIDSQVVIIHQDAILPTEPTKEGWYFTGWSESTNGVTKDIKAYAQFNINTYTVRFLNWDGTVLSTQTIDWSSDATPPIATKEGWHFVGWDSDYKDIRSDRDITAQFEINMYTVIFKANNTTIDIQQIAHGSAATPPAPPDRTGYDFKGWDKDTSNVTENMTVTAKYDIKKFKVTVTTTGTGTGTVTPGMNIVNYGDSLIVTFAPHVSSTINSIAINGKSISTSTTKYTIEQVTEDINISVTFNIKMYTVTWKNGSTILKTASVPYGTNITNLHPVAPEITGYNFSYWQVVGSTETYITAATTVSPKYTIKTFEVIGLASEHGKVTPAVGTAKYGWSYTVDIISDVGYHPIAVYVNGKKNSISYTIGDTSTLYDIGKVTENTTVRCDFEINTYTIRFVNEDGTTLQTLKVQHGQPAVYTNSPPTMPNGTFVGWDKTITRATANATITAQFKYEIKAVLNLNEYSDNDRVTLRFPLELSERGYQSSEIKLRYVASGKDITIPEYATVTSSDNSGLHVEYCENRLHDSHVQQYYSSLLTPYKRWRMSGRKNGTYTLRIAFDTFDISVKVTVVVDDIYLVNSTNGVWSQATNITIPEGKETELEGPSIRANANNTYRKLNGKNLRQISPSTPAILGYSSVDYISDEQFALIPGEKFKYGTLFEDRNANHILRVPYNGTGIGCAPRAGTLKLQGIYTDETGYVYKTKNSITVTVTKSVIEFIGPNGSVVSHLRLKVGQSVNLRVRYTTPDPVNKVVTSPFPYEHMPTHSGQLPPLGPLEVFESSGFDSYPYYTYGSSDYSRNVISVSGDVYDPNSPYNTNISFVTITGVKEGYAELKLAFHNYYCEAGYPASSGYTQIPSKINGQSLSYHKKVLGITVTE